VRHGFARIKRRMNTDKMRIFWIVIFLLANFLNPAFAEDISFEASVDSTRVALGGIIELDLTFYGTQNAATPYFPNIEGFSWQYLGPSTKVSIVNGKTSSSIAHRYKLVALKTGTLQIPRFSVNYKGKSYTSQPITIEVVPAAALGSGASGQKQPYDGQAQNLEDMVFILIEPEKKQAYVKEIIPLAIKLYYISKIKDIQYPQFSHQGFSVGEFSEPKRYRRTLNGISYNVIEFNTEVFAMRPGRLSLGPAELKCNLVVKEKRRQRGFSLFDDFFDDDFFGRYQSYPLDLKSIDIPITIVELPKEDVPDDFTGAVGNYSFYLQASPREVKVGDPITLKMTVKGEGNFKTVNPPAFDFEEDFKVYEPQAQQDKTSKTFEQAIIPKQDSVKEIPQVSFSFFDTDSGQYKRLTQGPLAIKVKPLAKGEELRVFERSDDGAGGTLRKREVLGRDIIYIKDKTGNLSKRGRLLYRNKLFIIIQFIPLLAVISVLILHRRRERLKSDIRYARRLRANALAKKSLIKLQQLLNAREPDKFFSAVFKTLQEYLGDKFHLPTAGITSNVIEKLKAYNVSQEILDKLNVCFANCDMARYAPSSITSEQMRGTFKLLAEIIEALEKKKG
jgi:hypothetical protein